MAWVRTHEAGTMGLDASKRRSQKISSTVQATFSDAATTWLDPDTDSFPSP